MADQPNFASLPPRQKITVIIVLMVFIFIVWEVIGMFRGNKDGTTIVPSQPAVAATAPQPKPGTIKSPPPAVQKMAAPAPVVMAPKPATAAHLSPQQSHPEMEPVPPSSIVLVQQEQVQSKYVTALNELQMLKIQKEIAETSQAIVAAKLATATAEKSITDLLTVAQTPPTPPPTLSPSSTNLSPPGSGSPMISDANGSYSVQSVSMEQDQWHAVVKFKDQYFTVSVGDMLPPDKSMVKAIDQHGVTLDTGGMEQRIPLTDSDDLPSSPDKSGGKPQ